MWERFFEEVDDKYLRCLECGEGSNRLISRSGNTSNLKRHVLRFHTAAYNEYLQEKEKTPASPKRRTKTPRKSNTTNVLDYTCRACLLKDQTGVFASLLEEPLKSIYYECTSVEVRDEDDWSKVLCSLCVARCDSSKAFREMALNSDEKMRQEYNATTSSAPEPVAVLLKTIPTQHGNIEIAIPAEQHTDGPCYVQSITFVNEQGEPISSDDLQQVECYVAESRGVVDQLQYEEETGTVQKEGNEETNFEEAIEDIKYEEEEEVEPVAVLQEESAASKSVKISTVQKIVAETIEACQFCNHKFSERSSLMSHYQEQHSDNVYACKHCDKSFICAQTWRNHPCPANHKKHRCNVCGKIYSRRDQLKLHMNQHSDRQGEEKYQCHLCEKQFRQKTNLVTHIKLHSDRRNFQCTECGALFKEKRGVVRHTALVHKKERPHTCSLCGQSFGFRYTLDRHMLVHTGEKLYPCTFEKCGRKLSSGNALKHHMYTHTGEKPYTCDKCDAAYRLRVTLNHHIKECH